MEHIDLPAKNTYLHQPQDCTEDCKARGNRLCCILYLIIFSPPKKIHAVTLTIITFFLFIGMR